MSKPTWHGLLNQKSYPTVDVLDDAIRWQEGILVRLTTSRLNGAAADPQVIARAKQARTDIQRLKEMRTQLFPNHEDESTRQA